MDGAEDQEVREMIEEYSQPLDPERGNVSIILAAGHGKRIKSARSKMLHEIWGRPSVRRVSEAARKGLRSPNQVIVVGIKADDVIESVGKCPSTAFAYQRVQKGTGHAVQVAMECLSQMRFTGNIYVFPGDMGLLDVATVRSFRRSFESSRLDMMVLTGKYEGPPEANYYGRIVRVPEEDRCGKRSGRDSGHVLEIIEHREILKLSQRRPHVATYRGREYEFSRRNLLENSEFNSGILAFKASKLAEHLAKLPKHTAEREIYLTDMISIFNAAGLKVGAHQARNSDILLGFNNKSVLQRMQTLAREQTYDVLKNIVTIRDEDNFFIAEEVVADIVRLDKKGDPLDIIIESGAQISSGVKLAKGVEIGRHVVLDGNIRLGEDVKIGDDVHLSTFEDQTLKIGRKTAIMRGDIIKGNTEIGENTRIESGVIITGSDERPSRIGNDCTIRGTTYIFGSEIEDECWIEHSVIVEKHVECVRRKDGEIQRVRFILPLPEGIDSLRPLPDPRKTARSNGG